jgi:hypothetical protein
MYKAPSDEGCAMMANASRAIRWSTVTAVTGVALVAAIVSYRHAYAVVSSHGETGLVARLYPLTIDGLIYAASMALLDAARRGTKAPSLARWLLGVGIAATLAANVAAGVAYGPLGAATAAWPALALVGSYELLMVIIRGQSTPALTRSQAGNTAAAPNNVADAVKIAYRASIAAGSPLSQRAMAAGFGLSRRRIARLVAEVTAEVTSHVPAAAPT